MRKHNLWLAFQQALLILPSEILAASTPLISRETSDHEAGDNDPKVSASSDNSTSLHISTSYHNTTGHCNCTRGLGSIQVRLDLKDLHCDESFLPTIENWNRTGAGQAYKDWRSCVDTNSTKWRERHSEPDFFGKDVLD